MNVSSSTKYYRMLVLPASVVKCTNFEKGGNGLHILAAAVSRAPTGNGGVLAPDPSDELSASAPEAKSRSPQSPQSPTLNFSYVLG